MTAMSAISCDLGDSALFSFQGPLLFAASHVPVCAWLPDSDAGGFLAEPSGDVLSAMSSGAPGRVAEPSLDLLSELDVFSAASCRAPGPSPLPFTLSLAPSSSSSGGSPAASSTPLVGLAANGLLL